MSIFTVAPICTVCIAADDYNNVMQFRHGGKFSNCILCATQTRTLLPLEHILNETTRVVKDYDRMKAAVWRMEDRLKKIDKEFEEKFKKIEHVDIKQQAMEDMLTPVIAVMGNDSYAKMMEDVIAAKKEFLSTEEK